MAGKRAEEDKGEIEEGGREGRSARWGIRAIK
jgi:hypothetical protein